MRYKWLPPHRGCRIQGLAGPRIVSHFGDVVDVPPGTAARYPWLVAVDDCAPSAPVEEPAPVAVEPPAPDWPEPQRRGIQTDGEGLARWSAAALRDAARALGAKASQCRSRVSAEAYLLAHEDRAAACAALVEVD